MLEDVSSEIDPIGAILFARMKHNKNELSTTVVITLADATKKKIPLFNTPKLTLKSAGPIMDLTGKAPEEKKSGKPVKATGVMTTAKTDKKEAVSKVKPAAKTSTTA